MAHDTGTDQLSVERVDADAAVVTMRGDHDVGGAQELRELLATLVAESRWVVVDLTATAFIDSSVLGVLIGALRRAREAGTGVAFVLEDEEGSPVGTLFGLTGLRLVFQIHRTREEALAALRGAA